MNKKYSVFDYTLSNTTTTGALAYQNSKQWANNCIKPAVFSANPGNSDASCQTRGARLGRSSEGQRATQASFDLPSSVFIRPVHHSHPQETEEAEGSCQSKQSGAPHAVPYGHSTSFTRSGD